MTKKFFSSLVSNGDDGENHKGAVEENDISPSQLTTEELKERISFILRAALYSSENGLEMEHPRLNVKTFSRKPELRKS